MAVDEVGIRVRLRERGKFSTESKKIREDIRGMGDEADHASKKGDEMNVSWGALEKTMGLIKPAGLLVGLGALAQVTGAVAAGGVAITSALGPAVGIFPAAGVGALAYASALGVAKLATTGIMDAVGGLGESMDADALDKLTPEAQNFARTLAALKPEITKVQQSVQKGLFPGLEVGLKGVVPLLTPIRAILAGVASSLGTTAGALGQTFGGKTWTHSLYVLGPAIVAILDHFGQALVYISPALALLLQNAAPLAVWLAKLGEGWAFSAAEATKAGAASGGLAEFFHKTQIVLGHLGSIVKSVALSFLGLGKAAFPVGRSLLALLDKSAAAMAAWVNSAEGQSKLAAYFAAAKPVIVEVSRLIRDVAGAFFTLAGGTGALPMVTALRTQLLPVLVDIANSATKNLGPALTDLIVNFGELIATMSGSSGPLVLYAHTLSLIVESLVWMLANVPGLSSLISIALVAGAAWKIMATAIALAKTAQTAYLVVVGAARTAVASYSVVMGVWRTVAIANGAAANVSSIAILRMVAAQRLAAAGAKIMAVAQGALNLVMSMNPIVLVIAALVAIGAAFVVAYNKIGWFRTGVDAVWSWIKDHWPLLLSILTGPIGAAVIYIVRHWDQVKSAASSVYNFVSSKFSALATFFGGLPGTIGAAMGGLFSAITSPFKSAINWVISKWNGLEFTLPKVKIPGVGNIIPGGGTKIGTPDIPLLAQGGFVKGSGSWVTGDAGPELNTMLPGGGVKVQPLSGNGGLDDAPSLDTSRSIRFAVTVDHTTNLDGEPIARSVTRHSEDAQARE